MKKLLLSIFLVLSVSANAASSTTVDFQFGFPHFFTLQLRRALSPGWSAGLGIGGVPFSASSLFYRPDVKADISDEYDIVIDPDLRLITSSLFAEWRPWGEISFLKFEFLVNIAGVGAKTYVQNKDSRERAPYAEVQAHALLPRVVFSYGTRFAKFDNWSLSGGLGLTFLLTESISFSQSGPAPAYFKAVPSTRASMNDGINNMEKEINTILSDSAISARVLPALWIGVTW